MVWKTQVEDITKSKSKNWSLKSKRRNGTLFLQLVILIVLKQVEVMEFKTTILLRLTMMVELNMLYTMYKQQDLKKLWD